MRALLAALLLCVLSVSAFASEPGYECRICLFHTGRVATAEWRWETHEAAGRGVVASWYDCRQARECSRSRRTASGERFDARALTFAHRSMAFGTRVRFTHGSRSVVCRANDRGPWVRGREFDLAAGCARAIGMTGTMRIGAERI